MIEYYGKKSGTVPKECQVIFSKLLNEAVNFASGGTNEFASALLVHLGISIVWLFFPLYICMTIIIVIIIFSLFSPI